MQANPIKSVQWLYENLDDPNLIILDATIPKVGMTQDPDEIIMAIPGARKMDLKKDFSAVDAPFPNTMPSLNQFEKASRALGINNESTIVVYDRHGIYSSPRAWWLFRVMGGRKVFVLDGGFPAWQKENYPVARLEKYKGSDGDFTVDFYADKMVDYKFVLENIGSEKIQIIDARSAGRFTGVEPEPREGMRGGHIPSSTNIPIKEILEEGTFKEAEDLRQIFNKAKAKGKTLIFTCGSGITACVLAAAAEKADFEDIKVFDGSWTEWALREELPIEKG